MSEPSRTAVEPSSGDSTAETLEDDASVIQRSRHEPESFATLFQRHAAQIGRYVIRRLGTGPSDDIVAETFLVAFKRRAAYDLTHRDARPWLYGIATNLIRRYQRDEVRLLRALERTGVDPVTEPFTEQVDSRVSADAQARRLAALIARLPAGQRDVLLLLSWTDLTYDQAAQALGVPTGTVRSRMKRVRSKLRGALGDTHMYEKESDHG